jgi:RNA polymerase sigma-70 factor, ECF subfamily
MGQLFKHPGCARASGGATFKSPLLELWMSEVSDAPPLPAATLDELMPLVFDELRRLARRQLAREHQCQTLQTTDLVHEAYLRLAGRTGVAEHGRAYFYAAAARAMRNVLVDAARRRGAMKRGAGVRMLSLDENRAAADSYGAELLELDEALERLSLRNPRHARTVECRFFGGMSVEDTATALGVSPRTVKSDWALARAWLYDALRGDAA